MVAPALPAISKDLHVTNSVVSEIMLSIFILAFVFGPFILGPLSEVYGRVRVLQSANLLFLVFNTACGAAKTAAQMIIFRFLAGFGGSASLAVSNIRPRYSYTRSLDMQSSESVFLIPSRLLEGR